MSEKKLNARIVHKHDVEANWLKATSFIPKQGEIIVYDIDANYTYERFKIGDGSTIVSALPFADDTKVDKVSGKGLSTNDYTTTEKNKLAGIATGANKTVVDSSLSASSTNPVQNKVVSAAINNLNTLVGDESVSTQISAAIASKADSGHTHAIADVSGLQTALDGKETSGAANSALTSAKSYTDTKISALINSAPTTLDTLGEIATAMEENADVVSALETAIGTKANASDLTTHTGNTSNPHNVTLGQLGVTATATELNYVDGVTSAIQTQLNAKVPTSRTVNGKALSANITLSASDVGADASGSASSALASAKAYTDEQIGAMVGDETVADQISTAVATKADTSHTHSYAGSSSVGGAATSANKLNTNAGSATNPVYFANGVPVKTTYTLGASVPSEAKFTDTIYTHPTYTSKSAGLYKVTVDGTGHVSAATTVAKSDITALGIPAQDTTYSAATTSVDGLMSASDKSKLDGIATGATKITVDSALSNTSTNPVQNKVVNTAITNLNTLVGDTAVSTQIANAIATKADKTELPQIATAASSDGVAFTVTVPGITALTAGMSFVMIPSRASASTTPTLNVNGLGAKNLRRRLSSGATVVAGYTTTWITKNKPYGVMYDGSTWVVEGHNKPVAADLYGSVLPKVASATLTAANWTGTESPYSQTVVISGTTANSKIDLQPTVAQIVELQTAGTALMTENNSGTITVYAIGEKPTSDYTIQVTITETTT